MRHPPDKRKPVVATTTGSRDDIKLRGIDVSDHTESLRDLQAVRLQRRFAMSLPLARTVAFLNYGGAA